MKLKQIFSGLIACLMFILTIVGAFAGGDVDEEYSMSGSFDIEMEPSPSKIPFSFTGLGVDETDRSCKPTGTKGPNYLVQNGKLVDPLTSPGRNCQAGQYIRYYECTDKTCSSKKDNFQHLWYKASSADVIDYKAYYTRAVPQFWATYSCYTCQVQTEVSSYTCYNSIWRGEPGTQYDGTTGICQNGCKKTTTAIQSRNQAQIVQDLCATKSIQPQPGSQPSITPPSPTPSTDTSSLSGDYSRIVVPVTVDAGESYQIKAVFTADVAGTYYLEAGMEEQPKTLSIITPKISKSEDHTS